MSRDRRDGERRRRDQALNCSTVNAPTAPTATAISTSWPSHGWSGPAATAVATIRWCTGDTFRCTCPPPDHHSLPIGASAEAAVAIHTHRLCILTITIAMITYVTGAATASEMKAVTTGRTVIQMSDRPLVTFPAAACTGHYP
jgi:hypothetical protein